MEAGCFFGAQIVQRIDFSTRNLNLSSKTEFESVPRFIFGFCWEAGTFLEDLSAFACLVVKHLIV